MDEQPAGIPDLPDAGRGLSTALETSLAALSLGAVDEALAALLRLYARELDGADAVAARAHRLARDVIAELGPENALHERVQELEARLAKRTALDRIGARLHAGLVEVLGTPKARGGSGANRGGGQQEDAPAGPAVGRRAALELLTGGGDG